MAKSMKKPLAIGLIAIATGLAYWGYQKSGGIESQLSNVVTGSHSDNVMILYIAAAACAAAGIFLFRK